MLIEEIEYVILRHPDPEAARQFMLDDGLLDPERQGDGVYLRSYGDAPFCSMATKGKAAFPGLRADLDLGLSI